MPHCVSPELLRKLRKIAQLPAEAKQCQFAVSITRLTSLKSLCREAKVAYRFVTYLARKTLERVERGQGRSSHRDTHEERVHRHLMAEALPQMEAWLRKPSDARQERLWELLRRIGDEQNEFKRIKRGSVRLIHDWELLLFEDALHCLLHSADEAGHWAYQVAKTYTERYDSRHGTGLIRESAPLLQDIVDFWADYFKVDLSAAPELPQQTTKTRPSPEPDSSARPASRSRKRKQTEQEPTFTHRQGQFLAFIHTYTRLHRRAPAETDLVQFFRITPPSVHGMIVKLEELGLITRQPGVARSVRVAIPEAEIPALEELAGPPW
jgi:hypothetical protein